MKTITSFICAFFLFIFITGALAQDQEHAWQEYMTPGPVHKAMAETAGDWNAVLTMWMDSTKPPQKYDLAAKYEMILGGRYLQQTVSGNMGGMPYEGMMILGYDNARRIFTAVWYDNFGTGTTVSTGNYDNTDSTLTLEGTMVDPVSGNDIKFREYMKIVDNDNQIITMYSLNGEKETKTMEIVLSRKS